MSTNFPQEIRAGFVVDAKRKKLWAVLLDILEVFLDMCAKHNLSYFAVDGTLLGAVRHKGFIPWDDDIDIGMPRKDYEAFLRLAPKHLPPHLSVHYSRNDPSIPWHFYAKIRDRNTTFISKERAHLDIHHGIYIDIFPMDGLPTNDAAWIRFDRRRRRLAQCHKWVLSTLNEAPSKRSALALLPFRAVRKLCGQNFFINRTEKLYMEFDFDQTDYEIHARFYGISRDAHVRRSLDSAIHLEFEHLNLRCPAGFDTYLTECYGDYMQLPPADKRGTWHPAFIDPERPYADYVPYTSCFKDIASADDPGGRSQDDE